MAYRIDGYSEGIAWNIVGHPVVQDECQGHPAEDCGEVGLHEPIGSVLYCDGGCEEARLDYDRIIAVMVGDDREHTFDAIDAIEIPDDSYCRECGQVGCGHNVYE